jgi:NAD-dependent deacetylase
VPTFRDALTGLWARYRPEELASPAAFERDPRLVWEWYAWRRGLVARAEPNPAHLALARLEARVPGFTLVTQNVDGLHQRAGSRRVIELHGSLARTKCSAEGTPVPAWPATDDPPPPCPRCGAPLRPDVVWFGESLPPAALHDAARAAAEAEVFLSVGTSGVVHPAAGLIDAALAAGALVLEINPEPTPYSGRVAHAFRGPAGVLLPDLVASAWPEA